MKVKVIFGVLFICFCIPLFAQQTTQRISLSRDDVEAAAHIAEDLVKKFHEDCRDVVVPQMDELRLKEILLNATSKFDNPDDRIIHITSKWKSNPTKRFIYDYLNRLYRLSHGKDRIYEEVKFTHWNTHMVGDIYQDPNNADRYVGTVVSSQKFEGTFRSEKRHFYRDVVQRTFYFNIYFYKSAITDTNVLVVKLGDVYAQQIQ